MLEDKFLHKSTTFGNSSNTINIDRTKVCEVNKTQLPEDAGFKGYETVIVQDLKITTDNIEFQKEIYYSATQHKMYRGPLPDGYEGNFGPTVNSLALIMKNVSTDVSYLWQWYFFYSYSTSWTIYTTHSVYKINWESP